MPLSQSMARQYRRLLAVATLFVCSQCALHAQTEVTSGQIFSGSVSNTGTVSYTINVTAGQDIYFSIGQTGSVTKDFSYKLENPSGTALINNFSTYNYNTYWGSGTTGGTYTLVVGVWGGTGTVNYYGSIVLGSGPYGLSSGRTGGAMLPGLTYSGSIYRGDTDIYTFTGVSGQ